VFSGIPASARPGGRPAAWAVRLLVAAGLVAIVFAWARVSGTVSVSRQVDWAPVGVAGVAAVVTGLLASVLVARQAVALRMARLAGFLTDPDTPDGAALAIATPATMAATNGTAAAQPSLVAVARMARYHVPTCPLTAGKAVQPASLADHQRAGRRPCGVCQP
jgi:hypothetical protein